LVGRQPVPACLRFLLASDEVTVYPLDQLWMGVQNVADGLQLAGMRMVDAGLDKGELFTYGRSHWGGVLLVDLLKCSQVEQPAPCFHSIKLMFIYKKMPWFLF
jgi:hypothetical protein